MELDEGILDISCGSKASNINLEKELFIYVKKGDVHNMRQLILSGAFVNAVECDSSETVNKYQTYKTPLHIAATKGYLDCVELLLENGADVDAKDRLGYTALHKAVENKQIACVKALINSNANCSCQIKGDFLKFLLSYEETTPLHIAASQGHLACIELLLENNADVNAKNSFDVTPLHLAAMNGHLSSVKALINGNADCQIKTNCFPRGSTPLHLAAMRNHTEIVKELIQSGADETILNENGESCLNLAARFASPECLMAFLQTAAGRNIATLPSELTGDTPLHLTVARRMLGCVGELLKLGSDPNVLNHVGFSPLHLAVRAVEEEAVDLLQLLLTEGHNPNLNCRDGSGFSLLDYTICEKICSNSKRNGKIAKLLIAYGADIDIQLRGVPLLEHEFRTPEESETEVLKALVRSMGKLRHLTIEEIFFSNSDEQPLENPLLLENQVDLQHDDDEIENDFDKSFDSNMSPWTPPAISSLKRKFQWYDTLSRTPRKLQHWCRVAIRQAMGPNNIRFMRKLPLPDDMLSYLLLEIED